ncbi:cellular nucleic acid-binding protein, partial [Trifolium medium]|nr:cellular nucleic acid-binding protein [Trifolium medium]
NCCAKTVVFPKPEEEPQLLDKKQVKESVKEHAELFAVFASLTLESKVKVEELPVICEFSGVFPGDVSDVPPEREVEFSI